MTSSASLKTAETIAASFLETPSKFMAAAFGGDIAEELIEKAASLKALNQDFNTVMRKHDEALEALMNLDLDTAEAAFDGTIRQGGTLLKQLRETFNDHAGSFLLARETVAAASLIQKQLTDKADIADALKTGAYNDLSKAHNASILQGYQSDVQISRLEYVVNTSKSMSLHVQNLKAVM